MQEWRRRQNKADNKKNVGSVRIGAALKRKVAQNSLLKITVQLNDHPIEFHLDSGAEANVINEETFAQIGRPKLQKTQVKAKLYDGTMRPFIGKALGTFIFGGKRVEHDCGQTGIVESAVIQNHE